MDKKFIGERITKLRMQKDISERELSLNLGKAHNYIYSISSGKILPTMESFLDICDYFEITPSDFFDEQIATRRFSILFCSTIMPSFLSAVIRAKFIHKP